MKWNVYYHDFNANQIVTFNVFDHSSFRKDAAESIRKAKCKEEFSNELRSDAMYRFWCKCEYEIILKPWVGQDRTPEIKVDIFNQLSLNWDKFVDYVWEHQQEFTEK